MMSLIEKCGRQQKAKKDLPLLCKAVPEKSRVATELQKGTKKSSGLNSNLTYSMIITEMLL